jgi:hypothetical protein
MIFPDCSGALNQQAVCNTANGQLTSVAVQVGTGTPEGEVIGITVGLHQFWDSEGEVLYVFNGTVGTDTGWVALNP